MFSDHLRKIDEAPAKTLLLIAAGLVIVCQLVAMIMVAGGQVEKAQLREARQAAARAATATCMEISRGAALGACDRAPPSLSAQDVAEPANLSAQAVTLFTVSQRY